MDSERFPINVRNERHKLQQAFLGTSERVNVSLRIAISSFPTSCYASTSKTKEIGPDLRQIFSQTNKSDDRTHPISWIHCTEQRSNQLDFQSPELPHARQGHNQGIHQIWIAFFGPGSPRQRKLHAHPLRSLPQKNWPKLRSDTKACICGALGYPPHVKERCVHGHFENVQKIMLRFEGILLLSQDECVSCEEVTLCQCQEQRQRIAFGNGQHVLHVCPAPREETHQHLLLSKSQSPEQYRPVTFPFHSQEELAEMPRIAFHNQQPVLHVCRVQPAETCRDLSTSSWVHGNVERNSVSFQGWEKAAWYPGNKRLQKTCIAAVACTFKRWDPPMWWRYRCTADAKGNDAETKQKISNATNLHSI